MLNQNGSSVCPVCEQQVRTNMYVQLVPLRPAHEGDKVRHTCDECDYTVPHHTEHCRVTGKRFLCLSHEPDDVRDVISSLGWSHPWELRHCPPKGKGKLMKVVADDADAAFAWFSKWREQLVAVLLG